MNYYIGDTHFGHKNILRLDSNNGSRNFITIEEHDNLIIENINKVVTPQDSIYFVGDVSWYKPDKTAELLERINCKNKFLIKGNHDGWAKDGRCKKLFQGIYDIKQIDDDGRQVILSHFPQMMWTGQHKGAIHIFAHVHNTREYYDYKEFLTELDRRIKLRDGDSYKPLKAYNVGCMLDCMNYEPKTLDELIKAN